MDSFSHHFYSIILQANHTDATNTSDTKFKSTPEGRAVAYISLVVMALLPIYFGSFKSIKHRDQQIERLKKSGQKPDTISGKDAMMFPLVASGALASLYVIFKLFSKEYVNLLLTGYFVIFGIVAMTTMFQPIFNLIPYTINYHLLFTRQKDEEKENLIDFKFQATDIVGFILSIVLGAWYVTQKHWIANNIFGIAFAVNGIELISLNKIQVGFILLIGLFVYDIFWVFGTDVMVTVAKSFEAPIKLIFPQDFLQLGVFGKNFAMLGLGDIVVPGIFIALLLRFDVSLKRNSHTYFYTGFIAYTLGLIVTILVMTVFNHAQPALLYLVPACLGGPVIVAAFKGDLTAMFAYQDHENVKTETKKE